MARIKFGGTIAGIRGTIGGLTFSANGTGTYVRSWGKGSSKPTPFQAPERSNLGVLPAAWNALTDGEREYWSYWALLPAQERTNSLGDPYFLSGYQAFLWINRQLQTVQRDPVATPPTIPKPAAPTVVTYAVYPSGDTELSFIEFDPDLFDDEDLVLMVEIGPSQSRISRPASRGIILAVQTPGVDTFEFQTEMENLLGTVQVGNTGYLVAHRQTVEGLRSEGLFCRFTVEHS